jgi:serine/threonine protein kinase
VALKILPRHFADDPQFVTRFKQEAKVLAQLQHPHILPVFDFGEADGYTYLVMPFIKSGTLTELLQVNRSPSSKSAPSFRKWAGRWTMPMRTGWFTVT